METLFFLGAAGAALAVLCALAALARSGRFLRSLAFSAGINITTMEGIRQLRITTTIQIGRAHV